MTQFDTSTDFAKRPIRTLNNTSDVAVPAKQSAISAALYTSIFAVPALCVTYFIVTLVDSVTIPLGVWATFAVTLFAYKWSQHWTKDLEAARETIYAREVATGTDINGDKIVGRPTTKTILVNRASATTDEDVDEGLVDFIRKCFSKNQTGLDYWEANGIGREDYLEWRRILSNDERWDRGSHIVKKNKGRLSGWTWRKGYNDADSVIRALYGTQGDGLNQLF